MSFRNAIAVLCALVTAALSGFSDAADAIRIGVVTTITGPQAEGGQYTLNGLKLAQEEINTAGGVLGRAVELRVEDNQTTNPGTVLAFSKLASEGGIAAMIGPIFSTQIQAASPTIAKAGIPTMIGGTDPSLTHINNRWVFRGRPNDLYSSRVIAEFGINSLKLKKWAIVHATDAFGSGGMKALTEALKAYGISPVVTQGYASNAQDYTAIVLAIKKSGADVLATYMPSPVDLGIFAKQLRQLGVTIPWIGSPSITGVSARNLAGVALHGTYGVADFTFDASDLTRAFTRKYRERYGIDPDPFATWSYDALHILALAMRSANGTDPEAIRKAILAIRGYQGLEGTYEFDQNGDGLHGYNIVRNENGKLVFLKRVDFPVQ
jgi:branched-chain amino acid transport system substrate-binding protein